jgi:hypothetical protein
MFFDQPDARLEYIADMEEDSDFLEDRLALEYVLFSLVYGATTS